MNNPTISIVANFYKSERYIPKLIKSILNQTFDDWELICINDCSPGNDAKVISKFVNSPKSKGRIRLINNETNLGITKAKKIGIENAKGKYLTFIDGDDWFAPQALEAMVTPAIKYNLDLVVMDIYRVFPIINYKYKIKSDAPYNTPIYYPELFNKFYITFMGQNKFSSCAYWGKLYKTEMIRMSNIKYPTIDAYEDVVFNFRLFPFVKSILFINYCGYYWRWGGVSSGKKNKFYTYDKIINVINDFYVERKDAIEKYNYHYAYKYLLIETKNVFYSNLAEIIKMHNHNNQKTKLRSYIVEVLNHTAYSDLKLLKEIDEFNYTDPQIQALINKDIDKIVDILYDIHKKRAFKQFIKTVIHKLIYPFAKV